jgi:SAM-dependent methyltransferase
VKLDPAIVAKVAARYARTASRFYVRGKCGSDPIVAQVIALAERAGGLGEVVDVGCGRGQLGLLLLELGLASRVEGFDWDAPKIEEASAAGGDFGDRARFRRGDTRTEPIAPCDTALLVDVLHYLTDAEQDALVDRAAASARRHVVIRELDPDRGWRSAVTRAQEAVTTLLRYNVGARVAPRPIGAIVERLQSAGFEVRVEPSWGGTPFSNVAVVGERVA